MKTKLKIVGTFFIIALVVGFVYNLYTTKQKVDNSFKVTKQLNQILLFNKDLNYLLVHFQSLNYDKINNVTSSMNTLLLDITNELENKHIVQSHLIKNINNINRVFKQKKELMEEFKSTNAVLDNSYRNILKLFKMIKYKIDRDDIIVLSNNIVIPLLKSQHDKRFINQDIDSYLDKLQQKYHDKRIIIELFIANVKVFDKYLIKFKAIVSKNKNIKFEKKLDRFVLLYKNYNQNAIKKMQMQVFVFVFLLIILLFTLYILSNKLDKKVFEINIKKKELENLTQNLEIKVQERTADLEIAKQEIEATHKHTRDSINYASLIQGAVISSHSDMQPFFKDSFVYWMPKDTVGGDIWLFNQLRHEDECLVMFIDCTGHGVPGAFVTMIVKAVEREIIANLKKHPEFDISPAIVMSHFNKIMKQLLRQETKESLSNAGWDGGIIYYNRRTQVLKFAGAETPLFYIDENQEFKTIKGNRYSVGYKKCSMDYEYKETIINVEEGMKFYCTTDGYLDQNGGEKDFPFGKKRFGNIIKENYSKPMDKQKDIFIDEMTKYEAFVENNDRNDDMTVIAFEIGKKSDFREERLKNET